MKHAMSVQAYLVTRGIEVNEEEFVTICKNVSRSFSPDLNIAIAAAVQDIMDYRALEQHTLSESQKKALTLLTFAYRQLALVCTDELGDFLNSEGISAGLDFGDAADRIDVLLNNARYAI